MKTSLTTVFALAACLFTTGCDEQSDAQTAEDELAEMIEICEELDGDCDDEIEEFLAQVEAVEAAETVDAEAPVDADRPGDLWVRVHCSHCGEEPVDDLTGDPRIRPHDVADIDAMVADSVVPPPTHGEGRTPDPALARNTVGPTPCWTDLPAVEQLRP